MNLPIKSNAVSIFILLLTTSTFAFSDPYTGAICEEGQCSDPLGGFIVLIYCVYLLFVGELYSKIVILFTFGIPAYLMFTHGAIGVVSLVISPFIGMLFAHYICKLFNANTRHDETMKGDNQSLPCRQEYHCLANTLPPQSPLPLKKQGVEFGEYLALWEYNSSTGMLKNLLTNEIYNSSQFTKEPTGFSIKNSEWANFFEVNFICGDHPYKITPKQIHK